MASKAEGGLMATLSLTKTQRQILDYMRDVSGLFYGDRDDRSMRALERRGLIRWNPGRKYHRAHWVLTEKGAIK